MNVVAYFVDGPLHGTHAQLPRPLPEWHVVKPAEPLWAVPMPEGMPDLNITITTGTYARSRAVLETSDVVVYRYTWKGWQ